MCILRILRLFIRYPVRPFVCCSPPPAAQPFCPWPGAVRNAERRRACCTGLVPNLTAPTGSVSVGDTGKEFTIGCTNSPPLARRCQKRGKAPRMLVRSGSQPDSTYRICQRWRYRQGIHHRRSELTAPGPTLSETRKSAAHAGQV